jgi:hypothetical protein
MKECIMGIKVNDEKKVIMSEQQPQKRLAIPKPPDNMTPNEALSQVAQLQYAQVRLLFDLQQEIEEQGRALTDMANDLEDLAKDRHYWGRIRREIDWAFWLVIGIPLSLAVIWFIVVVFLGASLFY